AASAYSHESSSAPSTCSTHAAPATRNSSSMVCAASLTTRGEYAPCRTASVFTRFAPGRFAALADRSAMPNHADYKPAALLLTCGFIRSGHVVCTRHPPVQLAGRLRWFPRIDPAAAPSVDDHLAHGSVRAFGLHVGHRQGPRFGSSSQFRLSW